MSKGFNFYMIFSYIMKIHFTAHLNDNLKGFYR